MTKPLSMMTEDEKRRLGLTGVLADGEYVHFDIMMRDGAPSKPAPVADGSSPRDLYIDGISGLPAGTTAQGRTAPAHLPDHRTPLAATIADAQAKRDAARQEYVDSLSRPSQSAHGSAPSFERYQAESV